MPGAERSKILADPASNPEPRLPLGIYTERHETQGYRSLYQCTGRFDSRLFERKSRNWIQVPDRIRTKERSLLFIEGTSQDLRFERVSSLNIDA